MGFGGGQQIKEGLWINPGLLEVMQKQELKGLAKTYGKFWCTWQFDRGERAFTLLLFLD